MTDNYLRLVLNQLNNYFHILPDTLNTLYRRETEEYLSYQINCPFAPWFHKKKSDKKPSCSVSLKQKTGEPSFYCFACGERGNLYNLVTRLNTLKPTKGLDKLAEDILLESAVSLRNYIPDIKSYYADVKNFDFNIDFDSLSHYFLDAIETPRAYDYLLSRNICKDTIKKLKFLYDGADDRVIYPVLTNKNYCVGCVGRTLNNDPRKYKNYLGFKAAEHLGGENIWQNKTVIVAEGFLCMARMVEFANDFKIDPACCWRAQPSRKQLDTLTGLDYTIYLAMDNDQPGNKGYEKAKEYLDQNHLTTKHKRFPLDEDQDINQLTKLEFQKKIESLKQTQKISLAQSYYK